IWAGVAISAGLICCGILPPSDTIAQRLFRSVFQRTIGVVRVDNLNERPSEPLMLPPTPQPVKTLAEAAALAGFAPRFPTIVLEGRPSEPLLSVRGPSTQSNIIRVADLVAKLQRAGVSPVDVPVPPEWDGVVMQQRGGASILAMYGDTIFFQ